MFRVRLSTDLVCGTCVNINVNCTVVVVKTEYFKKRCCEGEGDSELVQSSELDQGGEK